MAPKSGEEPVEVEDVKSKEILRKNPQALAAHTKRQ